MNSNLIKYLFILSCLAIRCFGMDEFAALSQIESGDNDFKTGTHHEVSRYQIMPRVWREAIKRGHYDGFNPTNYVQASIIASSIMCDRLNTYTTHHGRQPNTREGYLLWHCPARVDHPTTADMEIATRFANLCHKK